MKGLFRSADGNIIRAKVRRIFITEGKKDEEGGGQNKDIRLDSFYFLLKKNRES